MKRYENEARSYEEYEGAQMARWKSKKDCGSPYAAYVEELTGVVLSAGSILCNGVRNMSEVQALRKLFPGCTVSGTDICFEEKGSVIRCDFSRLPVEWVKNFDLVYSNSLDHAQDVDATLREWRRVMKDGGLLVMRLNVHGVSNSDIWSFEPEDIKMMEKCGFRLAKDAWPVVHLAAV